MFKQLDPKTMTKEQKIKYVSQYVHDRLRQYYSIVEAYDDEYTVEDCLFEDSEVNIQSLNNVKNLTDKEFETFFNNILFEEE